MGAIVRQPLVSSDMGQTRTEEERALADLTRKLITAIGLPLRQGIACSRVLPACALDRSGVRGWERRTSAIGSLQRPLKVA